uniref:R13L1/DRL21-like LRR repeat region domain-containing protein n=1 Tax=Ananas comosus var. bracteatus TaxID=296719 RepID=A0A6V7PES7_ANACO|nr:unnamed protein product [Ananas comosus var. bracteatus]
MEAFLTHFKPFLAQEWDADCELAEKILQGLQPHQNLTVLEIEGYLGKTFPRWLSELTLPNLVELTLNTCVRCETLPEFNQLHHLKILVLNNLLAINRLPALGQLPSLKVLKLSVLPGVKCLGSDFYGGDGAFFTLEELELSSLPSDFPLVKELSMCCDDKLLLSAFESGAFLNLEKLDIQNCTSLLKSSLPQVLIERFRSNPGLLHSMSASGQCYNGDSLVDLVAESLNDVQNRSELDGEIQYHFVQAVEVLE